MSGFYLMQRGWMDHPVFGGDLSKAIRWAWLIDRAAWKPMEVLVANKVVTISRGQLTASLRWLASTWQCSEPDVRRFISRLREEEMISVETGAGQMVITILNYDRHQTRKKGSDAPSDAASDAASDAPSDAEFDAPSDAGQISASHRNISTISDGRERADAPSDAEFDAPSDAPSDAASDALFDANKKEVNINNTLSEPEGSSRVARAVDAPGGVTATSPDRRDPGDHLDEAPLAGPDPQQPTLAGLDAPQVDHPQDRKPRSGAKTRWAGRVPDGWKREAAAQFPALNVELSAKAFENHWTDKAGAAGLKSNWHRTWQIWTETDAERSQQRGGRGGGAPARRGWEITPEHERRAGILEGARRAAGPGILED